MQRAPARSGRRPPRSLTRPRAPKGGAPKLRARTTTTASSSRCFARSRRPGWPAIRTSSCSSWGRRCTAASGASTALASTTARALAPSASSSASWTSACSPSTQWRRLPLAPTRRFRPPRAAPQTAAAPEVTTAKARSLARAWLRGVYQPPRVRQTAAKPRLLLPAPLPSRAAGPLRCTCLRSPEYPKTQRQTPAPARPRTPPPRPPPRRPTSPRATSSSSWRARASPWAGRPSA
mmetsp:Transcript_4575/g.19479  ORF Transcript_4575/g.19479 Transcript_4575/m.19479 type:complete len:235 (+) Transcript_4575:423-1127(+)